MEKESGLFVEYSRQCHCWLMLLECTWSIANGDFWRGWTERWTELKEGGEGEEGEESRLGSSLTELVVTAGVTSPVAVDVKFTRTEDELLSAWWLKGLQRSSSGLHPGLLLYTELLLELSLAGDSRPLSVPSNLDSSLIPRVAYSKWSSSSGELSAAESIGKLSVRA